MGDQEIAPPEEAEQRPPGDREDVVPLQAAPDLGEPLDAVDRGIAGIERAVQRADAGADHHVGGDTVLASDCSMPTWIAPKLPPPANTKAVLVGWGIG